MVYKLAALFSLLAVANAGYLAAPAYSHASYAYGAPHAVAAPAVVSQHANILRSHGNLGQVSTYSKSINTPYSSVTKHDVRVSNDALAYPYAHGYASAPAYSHTYAAAPAYSHTYAAAPAYSHTYATAPAYSHTYAATPAYSQTYAAAPAYGHGYAAHSPAGLLGVAYSAAPAAAHFSYSNGYGLHYSY